jgi:hypothetical protein
VTAGSILSMLEQTCRPICPRNSPDGSNVPVGVADRGGWPPGRCAVVEDAISIGGADLTDPDTYVAGMP